MRRHRVLVTGVAAAGLVALVGLAVVLVLQARANAELQAACEGLRGANAELQTACDERLALIERQHAMLTDLREQVTQATMAVAERDAEIERLRIAAAERLSVIEALSAAIEQLPR